MDKVRSAFGNHLENMQKVVNSFEMIGSAAGAFPPAMPAFAGVKADYDRVEAFFEHSSRVFERLSILENQADSGPLAVAIVRVFSIQLSICALELAAAYSAMQASIEELGETVGYASYSAIKTTQDKVGEVNDKVDELDKNIHSFRSTIHEDVQGLYASNINLGLKISEGFVSLQAKQEESHAMQILFAQQQAQILRAVERRNKDQHVSKPQGSMENGKGDTGDSTVKAIGRIKSFFKERQELFTDFQEAYIANRAQHLDIEQTTISGIADWIAEEPYFISWLDGSTPFLLIRGADGVGKSYLTFAITQGLVSEGPAHLNTAYFYFREDQLCLQSTQNAFACSAVQLAESNSRYAEQVATKLKEEADSLAEQPTWDRFFTSIFTKEADSLGHLWLILDGLDEAQPREQKIIADFIHKIKVENSKISIMITTRTQNTTLEFLKPAIIEIGKEKISKGIKALTKYRIRTSPYLRKLKHPVTKHILRKVVEHADCMLYVDHILRKLSKIGREDLILRMLEKMPENLHDLYHSLFDECARDRTDEQYAILKVLFTWLAYSKRTLMLFDAWEIIECACSSSEETLDLEGEIIGRSSDILKLSQVDPDESGVLEDFQDDFDIDSDDEDDAILEKYRDLASLGALPLVFHERSLRQYFRDSPEDHREVRDLRTGASDAHLLILTMCADFLDVAPEDVHAYGPKANLFSYWFQHLMELRVDEASDQTVVKVLDALYRIINSAPKYPQLFLSENLYLPRSPGTVQWYDMIMAWTARGSRLPVHLLNVGVRDWASSVTPQNLVLTLSQGQFSAWTNGHNALSIMSTWYWYLKPAFDLYKTLCEDNQPAVTLDRLEEILLVVNTFEPGTKSAKSLRAIGGTAYQAMIETDEYDTDVVECLRAYANSYLRKSLDLMVDASLDKIDTLGLLAHVHAPKGDYTIPLSHLDEALAMIKAMEFDEVSDTQRQMLASRRLAIVSEKASRLHQAGYLEEALHMYESQMEMAGDDIHRSTLTEILNICDELDPSGHRFALTIRTWSNNQRNEWFRSSYQYQMNTNDLEKFTKIAKDTNNLNFLLDWMSALEKKLAKSSNEGLLLLRARSVISHLYLTVVEDTDRAKKVWLKVLSIKPEMEPYNPEILKEALIEQWIRLSDYIFSQFQLSSDPKRKAVLLNELKSIPRVNTDDELKDSHVGMLFANMLRVMGPAQEYQHYMEEIFSTCITGLEDSVLHNDGPSLRLLAKILSSLDGLERDARIAYSAQFSVLDRSVLESDKSSGIDPVDSESGAESNLEGISEYVEGFSIGHDEGSETSGTLPQSDIELAEGESKKYAESSLNRNDARLITSDVYEPRPFWLWEENVSGYLVYCNTCREYLSRWTRRLYLCLICLAVDICEKCYNREVVQRRSISVNDDQTSYICNENHRYLKGYMKDWRGVKDGVIRIGDEELPVKEWIKGLKEVRWPQAWERYWLSQGGLKDIDDGSET
ncbi:hypothetical protein N0V90_008153 [Kalmusia sp. IMI 367209]|nr:hypothetical protein N0V90_008153 [Kalmusia sp. IMI 367209]